MKLTILIAFCLVIASASAGVSIQPRDDAFDYMLELEDDGVVEIEPQHIFSALWWALRASLRTLKGVHCTIQQVIAVKSASEQFLVDIHSCGVDTVNTFKNVIAAVQQVIATSNSIIQLNQTACNNDESTDGKTTTTASCFTQMMKQLWTLKKNISNVMTAIKKLPKIPADGQVCSSDALAKVTNAYNSFPSNVKSCSKLTS